MRIVDLLGDCLYYPIAAVTAPIAAVLPWVHRFTEWLVLGVFCDFLSLFSGDAVEKCQRCGERIKCPLGPPPVEPKRGLVLRMTHGMLNLAGRVLCLITGTDYWPERRLCLTIRNRR